MEKLEKTVQETLIEASEIIERENYSGFQLIEEKEYKGPTSIKYWM